MNTEQELAARLPITRSLTSVYVLSIIIAILVGTASVIGILYHADVYPREDLVQSFLANDIVNLFVGLPTLIASVWWARRGRLIGLLLWPGALFLVLYQYAVYVLAMPFNVAFLLHLTLLTMALYAIILLLAAIDGRAVQQRLTGCVPGRVAGSVLVGIGLLFFLRVAIVLVGALVSGTLITDLELALHISDLVVAPAVVIGGMLLLCRQEFGYVTGLGLLFQVSMLFVGLAVFLVVQPFVSDVPFVPVDVVVVLIFGMVSMIPFALFARGVVRNCPGYSSAVRLQGAHENQ